MTYYFNRTKYAHEYRRTTVIIELLIVKKYFTNLYKPI